MNSFIRGGCCLHCARRGEGHAAWCRTGWPQARADTWRLGACLAGLWLWWAWERGAEEGWDVAIWGVVAAILAVVGLMAMVALLAMRAERRRWEAREAMAKTEGEADARRAETYRADHRPDPHDALDLVFDPPEAATVESPPRTPSAADPPRDPRG